MAWSPDYENPKRISYVMFRLFTLSCQNLLPLENVKLNNVLGRKLRKNKVYVLQQKTFRSGEVRHIRMLSLLRKYFINQYFVG